MFRLSVFAAVMKMRLSWIVRRSFSHDQRRVALQRMEQFANFVGVFLNWLGLHEKDLFQLLPVHCMIRNLDRRKFAFRFSNANPKLAQRTREVSTKLHRQSKSVTRWNRILEIENGNVPKSSTSRDRPTGLNVTVHRKLCSNTLATKRVTGVSCGCLSPGKDLAVLESCFDFSQIKVAAFAFIVSHARPAGGKASVRQRFQPNCSDRNFVGFEF